jgi:release factor glutamine methyltransferase
MCDMPTTSIGQFIARAGKTLSDAGIETSRLDILVILEDVLGKNRALILAHSDDMLDAPTLSQLNKFIVQRKHHIPLAYIRGRAEFYGRNFIVNQDVLVPRPESESIIDLLRSLPVSSIKNVADLGTGSGCLGITAALELGLPSIDLVDISTGALKVARQNTKSHSVQASLINSSFQALLPTKKYDVLLANLPYVPYGYPVNQAARHEPEIALYADEDGLRYYRELFEIQADSPVGYIITESLLSQHPDMEQLATKHGYTLGQTLGLAQLFVRKLEILS